MQRLRNRNPKIVEMISDHPGFATFKCKRCGQIWAPAIAPGRNGNFYRGSWQCPNGCKA